MWWKGIFPCRRLILPTKALREEDFMSACSFENRSGRQHRRKGYVLLLGSLLLLFIVVPAAGLAVDAGMMYLVQSVLSAASDAAALAGARALSRGADDATQRANAEATANAYFHANFQDGYMWSGNLSVTSVAATDAQNLRSITTTASVDLPLIFLRFFRVNATTLTASSKATRRDANVMIIMDRSGSLQQSGACTPLKAAAVNFVEKFAEGRDNMGLITFATSSRVDVAMSTTFKNTIESTLNIVTCTGATSSAQALWQGYESLAALNQSGALNAIVFFTDGRPTATSENFPVYTTYCTNSSPKLGVLTFASGPQGLYVKDANAQPLPPNDDINVLSGSNVSGCRFVTKGPTYVTSDVKWAPTTDYWGNSLTATGYKSVTPSGSGLSIATATNIQNFSTNAADHAALRIRRGDPDPLQGNQSLANVVIFTIGLGDVDDVLLKRIANDPSLSPNPVAAGMQGRYEYAGNATALNDAFTRVASEVLRLAQ
ncbi:MAG: hypothetical protein C5B51_17840 [Terriglobia bacterium]|nr:MAG: hypothetical protein C5B51_17840 [Terriglobia bacterium]